MSYTLSHLKLGGILDQAISLTKNHFGVLFQILAIVYIPFSIVSSFAVLSVLPPPPETPEQAVAYQQAVGQNLPLVMTMGLLSAFVILPLTNAAIVHAVAHFYLGKSASAVDSIKVGLKRVVPLIWTSILMGIAIMGGLILLIIPGILCLFWFALSTHVVVLEGINGGAALGRSRKLVSGNMGTLFVLLLMIGIISYAVGMVAGLVPQLQVQVVLRILLQAVMTVFSAAALVVFYFSCRCSHENFDLEHLAESMGEAVPEAVEPDGF
ncbi:MAG: hypothetical protein R3C59_14335 [Planctomycetaceae bacterium]